ncbi:MAG: hypothetical protein ACFCU8_06760 [Thermosynechococcaceae cyanobacterium]
MQTPPSGALVSLLVIILAVYVAPILLMFAEVIPSDLKYHVLIGMSTVLLVYA